MALLLLNTDQIGAARGVFRYESLAVRGQV